MNILRMIWRAPAGRLGMLLVLAILGFALLGPVLSPYDPAGIKVAERFAAPSWAHLFGTDQLGRDLATRLAVATRLALGLAIGTVALALACGVALGAAAAFAGKWTARAILIGFDLLAAFPSLILALAVIAALGPGLGRLVPIIAASLLPHFGRIARAQALGFRHSAFVEAERALGAGTGRILLWHVLPNMLGPLIVLVSMDLPVVVTLEAGLSFLGLGVPPPLASLGTLLNDGYATLGRSPGPVIAAAAVLAIMTLGFTLVGEALRDAIDPRLRSMA
jgi:peptide/nickel transport system permease protein